MGARNVAFYLYVIENNQLQALLACAARHLTHSRLTLHLSTSHSPSTVPGAHSFRTNAQGACFCCCTGVHCDVELFTSLCTSLVFRMLHPLIFFSEEKKLFLAVTCRRCRWLFPLSFFFHFLLFVLDGGLSRRRRKITVSAHIMRYEKPVGSILPGVKVMFVFAGPAKWFLVRLSGRLWHKSCIENALFSLQQGKR